MDPVDGKRARTSLSTNVSSADRETISKELQAKELELKKKLAAYASFNQSERDLLKKAFNVVSSEQQGVPGLCSRNEFAEVWDRLGTKLTAKVTDAFFAKYGEDRTGRMPVDLFITACLESRNRVLAMEEKRTGAYEANNTKEYRFNGRIKYFPCRRGVYAPSAWDPKLAARSAKPPKEGLTLDWVYGYGGLQNTSNNLFYNEDDHAVYYTAAVGVVFDRHVHKQYFFHGHDNDIRCMAMHPGKKLVATGQQGTGTQCPIVCIWDTTVDKKKGKIRGKVAQLPFENVPAVIALAFSDDGERLVAVTNNADHTVHVFDWKLADQTLNELANTRKGAPSELDETSFPGLITVGKGGKGDSFPHVYGASWNPYGKFDKYDTTDSKHEWSEFVTYGAKHVRLWRLHHDSEKVIQDGTRVIPDKDHVDYGKGSEFYGKDGKRGVSEVGLFTPTVQPCDVTSVAWLPPRGEDAKLYGGAVLVTGTRSGSLLLWHTGTKGLLCIREIEAHAEGPLVPSISGGDLQLSGIRAMCVRDDGETLVTTGSDGKVMWWATAALTGACRSKTFIATPHTTRSLTGDDHKTPPTIRALDCHKHSSDVMLGTNRCDIWEIDDVNGAHPMSYGHAGDVKALAVHPKDTHVFATGAESGKLHLWNSNLKMLKAKVTLHHPASSCAFSPDGKHVAVGCKDGCLLILSYKNIVTGQFKQVIQRPDDTRCEFHHMNEQIDVVRYSPDGSLLAVGSRDTFIDIYDVTGSAVPGRSVGVMYHRLHRLKGHSSYITHLDWSTFDKKIPERHVLQSTCAAYELLYYDANSGKQVRESLRDEKWDTQTCTLGFSVMGIWGATKPGEKVPGGTDITSVDRGPVPGRDSMGRRNKGELLAAVDDSGKVKLYNYPCVVKHAPFRAMRWRDRPGLARKPVGESIGYIAHSQNITNVKFASEGAYLITTGGFDRSVMQWRLDESAIEQKGSTKRIKEPRPYVRKDPLPKVTIPRGGDLSAVEAAALAEYMQDDDEGKTSSVTTLCDYLVTVHTGDAKGAGTSSSVLFSAAGSTSDGKTSVIRETYLDTSPDNFKRNSVDVFPVRANDIGTLTHLKIGHNDAGDSPGWLLKSVTISNVTKGWEKTLWPQGVWLDRQRGGETHVTLLPSKEEASALKSSLLLDKTYVVTVKTSDQKGSGTDANVSIEVFGENGKSSGMRNLDNASDNFTRGKTDSFVLSIAGMGSGVKKARIGHDNVGFGPAWCIEGVSVRSVETGEVVPFDLPPKGIWLENQENAVDIFPLPKYAKPAVTKITYRIQTHTCDVQYAATDANVFIEITGEHGTSGKQRLSNSRLNFERGAIDVFFVKSVDLGALVSIKIGHDDAGSEPGWCLDRILVSELDKDDTLITFDAGLPGKPGGRWLDTDSEEGVTEVTLTPTDGGNSKNSHKTFYGIETKTSDVKFAGSDANIHVTLIGVSENGRELRSRQFKLNNGNDKTSFQRAALDSFEVGPVSDDLFSDLIAVELSVDGSGEGSSWRCDFVTVWNLQDPERRFVFPVNSWFDKTQAPHKTTQVINVEASLDPESDVTIYRVEVLTSDLKDAGTNANVFVQVVGELGDTGELALDADNSENVFKQGNSDTFTLVGKPNVGAIKHILVGHDESNVNNVDPDWHVSTIKVHNVKSNVSELFSPNCWIGKQREPIFASKIVLTPDGAPTVKLVSYRVTVKTSDVRAAGTEANVSLRLIGKESETETVKETSMKLLTNASDAFKRGSTDVFLVSDIEIGVLDKVEVTHDGIDGKTDWHLKSIQVANLDDTSGAQSFFHHQDWVKGGAPVTLLRETDGVKNNAGYKVTVHTSDTRAAGTDGTVTIQLVGDLGGEQVITDSLILENSPDNFQRAAADTFLLETKNVGVVTGCVVGVENGSAWCLRTIAITNLSLDELAETRFQYDDWLDTKTPSVMFSVDDAVKKSTAKYKVTVNTSDLKGSATGANVSLTIFGVDGIDTGVLPLENSSDNFSKGKQDVFHLETLDVRTISKIRLGHDNSTENAFGTDPSWHCKDLVIENMASGDIYNFAVNKWFDENKAPNMISHVLYPTGDLNDNSETVCAYEITTHTSDTKGAGTDANVSVTLVGSDANGNELVMGPVPLEAGEEDFKRGAVDVFTVPGPAFATIKQATVTHDGAGVTGGTEWGLKMVEFSKTNAGDFDKVVFWCGDVITANTPKTLLPVSSLDSIPQTDVWRYTITVKTSTDRGSGTDANVWIQVFGEKSDTGVRSLDVSSDDFNRGGVDVFTVESLFLGEIGSIKIGHDNSGLSPNWKLESVTVKDTRGEGTTATHFHANKWIDTNQPEVELMPSDSFDSQLESLNQRYTVTVRTGSDRGAGTDANVWIAVYGANGDTGRRPLDMSKDDFKRSGVDSFTLESPALGDIRCIKIGHDNTGVSPNWMLQSVTVESVDTKVSDSENQPVTHFMANKWIDSNVPPFVTELELTPSYGLEEASQPSKTTTYAITTRTSDETDADSNANVAIQIQGTEGVTQWQDLAMWQGAGHTFCKGAEDKFSISGVDVGVVTSVTIKHDGVGTRGKWRVLSLDVRHDNTGAVSKYIVDDWIGGDDGGSVEVTLTAEKDLKRLATRKVKSAVKVEGEIAPVQDTVSRIAEVVPKMESMSSYEKAPSPRRDTVPVPVPVTPVTQPVFTPEKQETPEERETREFTELEARVAAEAETEERKAIENEKRKAAEKAKAEAQEKAQEAEERKALETKKAMSSMSLKPSKVKSNKGSSTSLTSKASSSKVDSTSLLKTLDVTQPSAERAGYEFEMSISRDPVSLPLKVRILGKGGEGVAIVPQDVAFASFTLPTPMEFITKVYVGFVDDEDVENIPSVALERVSLSDPNRGDTCAFQLHGAVLDATHLEVRARREATPGLQCEEWEEAVARKDGREKKYWFSQSRNESVWKEPTKYYPVTFPQPDA